MRVTNIKYDISGDDEWETDFNNLPLKKQAKIFGMTLSKYGTLTGEERESLFNDILEKGTNSAFNKQFGLKNNITIPKNISEDGIADYISDKTGYCVYSWTKV